MKEIHKHSIFFYCLLPSFRRLKVKLVSVCILRAPPRASLAAERQRAGVVGAVSRVCILLSLCTQLHGLEEMNLPEQASSYLTQGAPTLLPSCFSGKEYPWQRRRRGFDPSVGKIPWKRKGNPLQFSCLENSTDKRSPAGCGPRSRKETDTSEYALKSLH